jgi:hypothetical protein
MNRGDSSSFSLMKIKKGGNKMNKINDNSQIVFNVRSPGSGYENSFNINNESREMVDNRK